MRNHAKTRRTTPQPPKGRALSEATVAEMTGFAIRTLQDRRHRRLGPPYHKHGSKVIYFEFEVFEWCEQQFVGGTCELHTKRTD